MQMIRHRPGIFIQPPTDDGSLVAGPLPISGTDNSTTFTGTDRLPDTGQHLFQTVERESGTDGQNDIALCREQITVQTKNFPEQSFYSVAPDCIPSFTVHADSQPSKSERIVQEDQGKTVTSQPSAGAVDSLKLPCCPQSMIFREREAIQLLQAANCMRPFARLLLITARPERVFIRTRKPWVRARLVLLG